MTGLLVDCNTPTYANVRLVRSAEYCGTVSPSYYEENMNFHTGETGPEPTTMFFFRFQEQFITLE
jgi:hypothetical protein